jgi:hypothetical protein
MTLSQLRHLIRWPLATISPSAWLRLHPEEGQLRGAEIAASNPMPGHAVVLNHADFIRSLIDQYRVTEHLPAGELKVAQQSALIAALSSVGRPAPDQEDPPHPWGPAAEITLAVLTVIEAHSLPRSDAFRQALVQNATARFSHAGSNPMPG